MKKDPTGYYLCEIARLNYKIKNLILLCFQKILFNNKDIKSSKKILIYRLGSLGDCITALPAIYNIRKNFYDAKIDILTHTGGSNNLIGLEQLIDQKIVDNIINYGDISRLRLIKVLRSSRYDLFIELPEYLRDLKTEFKHIIFAKLIGVRSAFGWQIASSTFLKNYQERCISFDKEAIRLLKILKENGLTIYEICYPLNFTQKDEKFIDKVLKEDRITDKDRNIAFVVGAKILAKRWPEQYFKEVAKYLINKKFNILIVGGKEDTFLGKAMVSEFGMKVYDFTGELTPLQSAILLKSCRLAISNDTGTMHLSYASGTPVLALFSSWDYTGKWYPLNEDSVVIRKEVPCSLCFRWDCKDNICMKKIKPQEVINVLQKNYKI